MNRQQDEPRCDLCGKRISGKAGRWYPGIRPPLFGLPCPRKHNIDGGKWLRELAGE